MMKDKFVTVVLSIILFVVPVLIIPDSWGEYNILKIVVLLICGFILLLTTITRIEKLKFDTADKLIAIFGVLSILSTIFSSNAKKSLIGESNRYEGLFTILTYILIYYNAKYFFKNYKNFINIATVVYILICLFAILQFCLPKVYFLPIFGKGANGTFGNTNFMGSFVSIILPAFTLGYIITNKKRYLICSAISFTSMVMCIARSAMVAFILSVIMILVYVVVKRNKLYFKRFIALIFVFALCFSCIKLMDVKLDNTVSNKMEVAQNEIKQITSKGLTNSSGSGRIGIWKLTSKLLYKVPILGCGIDALKDGLRQWYAIENLMSVITYHGFIDKAHNEYLQIAVTVGIPALVVYLSFIAVIGLAGLKKLFKSKVMAIYLIIIFSYLVQAFFNISTIGVAPIFWFVLGMTSRLGKKRQAS